MSLALFAVAAAFSSLGTVAGFGGGVFVIPIMVMGFDVPIELAIGAIALSLFPSSLLSTIWNTRKKTIDFRLMVALEIPTILGAILGAKLTNVLPTRPLEWFFAAFLVLLSFRMFNPSIGFGPLGRLIEALNRCEPRLNAGAYRVGIWAAALFGVFSGVIAGLFGIGGGILKTPIMINVFKVPVRVATGTALCMMVFTSLGSGMTHYQLGHVDPEILLPCAAGFLTGAVLGNLLGVRISDRSVKRTVAVSIGMAGIAVFVHAIFLAR